MTNIQEEQLIEVSIEEREKFLGEVEVLEKVKSLILLPNTEVMSTKMVADWFEVDRKLINKVVSRNENEIKNNGMSVKTYAELRELVNGDILSPLENIRSLIPPNGTAIFSKRAVLNIAMLLRDSIIAKRVRTTLLDHQEVLTDEQKVVSLDEERRLALEVMFAPTDGEKMLAFNTFNEFKNRHIKELENRISEQEPMVEFHNGVALTDGSDSIINVAKSFGIGEKKFFQFLRSTGMLFNQDGYNIPKQHLQNEGYFKVKMGYYDNGFQNKTTYKTTVTGEGKTYLYKIVQKYGGTEVINKLRLNEIDRHVQNIKNTSQNKEVVNG